VRPIQAAVRVLAQLIRAAEQGQVQVLLAQAAVLESEHRDLAQALVQQQQAQISLLLIVCPTSPANPSSALSALHSASSSLSTQSPTSLSSPNQHPSY